MSQDKAVISDEEFAKIWNDPENYPTIRRISEETGYSYGYVKNKAKRIRNRFDIGKSDIELIDRSGMAVGATTLPEMRYRFAEEMKSEDCLRTMQDMAKQNPTMNITRIQFREYTGLSDSTWTRYFGTMLEFKRQAGIDMSRHQHAVERHIAKHASVDHYREFNERHNYDHKFLRGSGKKHQVVLGCSDLHDEEIDPFYLRVLIQTAKMLQPDIINFGGDIFDLPEFGKFSVDPRNWDVVGRIKFVHENIFRPLREVCPRAQFDFVEGNHEFRLLRHMADATPALQAVLSDLLGMTVPKLLGLDEFEINYIARADLAAYNKGDQKKEIEKSYIIYHDAMLVHHHPHASQWGLPGWNGHHHSHKVSSHKSAIMGAYKWLQLGCGHMLKASYAEGEFWDLGFNIAHINTESKSVTNEYIHVTDMACVGGVIFYREEDENVGYYAGRAAKLAA